MSDSSRIISKIFFCPCNRTCQLWKASELHKLTRASRSRLPLVLLRRSRLRRTICRTFVVVICALEGRRWRCLDIPRWVTRELCKYNNFLNCIIFGDETGQNLNLWLQMWTPKNEKVCTRPAFWCSSHVNEQNCWRHQTISAEGKKRDDDRSKRADWLSASSSSRDFQLRASNYAESSETLISNFKRSLPFPQKPNGSFVKANEVEQVIREFLFVFSSCLPELSPQSTV